MSVANTKPFDPHEGDRFFQRGVGFGTVLSVNDTAASGFPIRIHFDNGKELLYRSGGFVGSDMMELTGAFIEISSAIGPSGTVRLAFIEGRANGVPNRIYRIPSMATVKKDDIVTCNDGQCRVEERVAEVYCVRSDNLPLLMRLTGKPIPFLLGKIRKEEIPFKVDREDIP